jgi:hypothetical protein
MFNKKSKILFKIIRKQIDKIFKRKFKFKNNKFKSNMKN